VYRVRDSGDINLKHVAENEHAMERIQTLTSTVAGVLAGLFNSNLYSGVAAYVGFHLLMALLIVVSVGEVERYLVKRVSLLGGMGSGILVFICMWIITFNIVYTL
jgi:hypothetical protein